MITLLAAAKWIRGRHARRHTETVAARVERKLLAEGELRTTAALRPLPADMLKTALRPQRAAIADSKHSSRSGAPSPAGFRTDGRISPVISPVTSPRPDASPAKAHPNNPTRPTSPASPTSPIGSASPANPPRPPHLLERDVSRGAGGLAPDARLQARSSMSE